MTPAFRFWFFASCITLYSSTALAQQQQQQQPFLRIEAAAAGGFTGFQVAEALPTPAYDCTETGSCFSVPDSVDLVRNSFYRWTPALSSGVLLFVNPDRSRDIGFGFGIHAVFVPDGDQTRPLPALTAHVGSSSFQAFFGVALGASDEVEFPDGRDKIRVRADNIPDFVQPKSGSGPNYFFGIVIGGISIFQTGTSANTNPTTTSTNPTTTSTNSTTK